MKKVEIDLEDIRNEILYTDSIYMYIRKNRCHTGCDTNDGEIGLSSKQAFIMGYIKELENKLGI